MSREAARALQIQAAIDHLKLADPVLGSHIERVGPYTLKQHRNRYEMLVRSIISQQISTKAARSVRLRLQAATPSGRITPEDLAATMFAALGLDPETEIRDKLNRPLPIARGKPIGELFA